MIMMQSFHANDEKSKRFNQINSEIDKVFSLRIMIAIHDFAILLERKKKKHLFYFSYNSNVQRAFVVVIFQFVHILIMSSILFSHFDEILLNHAFD